METQKISIQEYLSLGYLYLLLTGLINDIIFYNNANINILHYSSFLDILITPINVLTGNILVPAVLVVMSIFMYFLNIFITKEHQKKIRKRKSSEGLAEEEIQKLELQSKKQEPMRFLFFVGFLVFGFYTGIGMGMGEKLKKMLKDGNVKPDFNIVFNNGKDVNVKIIGQNSMYIFYIPEKTNEVIITPIVNTIFQMKKIKK